MKMTANELFLIMEKMQEPQADMQQHIYNLQRGQEELARDLGDAQIRVKDLEKERVQESARANKADTEAEELSRSCASLVRQLNEAKNLAADRLNLIRKADKEISELKAALLTPRTVPGVTATPQGGDHTPAAAPGAPATTMGGAGTGPQRSPRYQVRRSNDEKVNEGYVQTYGIDVFGSYPFMTDREDWWKQKIQIFGNEQLREYILDLLLRN